MRILVAPQTLKESLAGPAVAAAIGRGLRSVWPDCELDILPIADGGEGTAEALVAASGGALHSATVPGPLGRPVQASWGMLPDRTAVVEIAAASGLMLVPREERNPKITDSLGTGLLIKAAFDRGARRLIIGLGGSGTNDGGAGLLRGLGARLLDDGGNELPPGGAALLQLRRIDLSGIDTRLLTTPIAVASDVSNPLTGPRGASAVFGPQKGALPADVALLDRALERWAAVLFEATGVNTRLLQGAGAAGGAGSALLWLPNAVRASGIEIVLQAARFAERARRCQLVITAEGRLDSTSSDGKATVGVAQAARTAGVPTVCLVGGIGLGGEQLVPAPFAAVLPILDGPAGLEDALGRAENLVAAAAARLARLLDLGQQLRT